MNTARRDRFQAALLLLPVLVCAWPFVGSPLRFDVVPQATGIGFVALALLPSAVFLATGFKTAPSVRALWFLLAPLLVAVFWVSVDHSTDTFEGSRVLMHWVVALHCLLAGAGLGREGAAFFVRGLLIASVAFVAFALFDAERSFTGALGNTGSISEVGLAGAVAGAALAVLGSGVWRFLGLATLVVFLAYTARVPVLAGSLACALALSWLVFAARRFGRGAVLAAACALALSVIALVVPIARRSSPAPVAANAAVATASPTGGVGVRLQVWRGALALFAEHPLLGTGAGQFAARFPEHRRPEEIERTTYGRRRAEETEVEHPHNDWLAPWLEGGLAAGLPWAIFLCAAACAAWKKRASSDPFELAVAAAVLALLANALVRGPLLQNPASSPLAFALFGVLLAREADPARAFPRRVVVILSTLLLAAVSVRAKAFVSHGFALQEVARAEASVDEVREANAAALDACPDSVIALTTSARLSEGRGEATPIVLDLWKQVLEHRPQRIEALLSVGRLLASSEPERAQSAFERVLRLDPNHPVAMQNLGTLALNAGRVAEGLGWLDRLPPARAPSKDWIEHLAALLALRGIDDAADALFERVDPTTRDASAEQCLVFAKQAELDAKDKLVVDAWKARANRRWARRFAEMEQFDDAVRLYRQDLRLCEIHDFAPRRIRLELGAALRLAGREAVAAVTLRELVPTTEDLAALPNWARGALRAAAEEAKK